MKKLSEKSWALVTGASSGLGVDFADELAQKGHNLILVARREDRLYALAKQLETERNVLTYVIVKDLSKPDAAGELYEEIKKLGFNVEILINNAGFGIFGEFLEQSMERIREMIRLNISALTELTYLFAQDMKKRKRGQIMFLASVVAFQASPNYSAYAATKAYVLSLGEALHEELKPYGITVTVLSPGATATEFFDISGQPTTAIKRAVMMLSRPVAKIGLTAMENKRASIVAGWKNALMTWSTRLAPRSWQRKIAHKVFSAKKD